MVFAFKQFIVSQRQTVQRITTDSILLGAWAEAAGRSLLDVGTGCGVIALMMAQRNKTAHVTGIEIDKFSCEEAGQNFKNSPWSERLNAIHGDFLTYRFPEKFDWVVSNPPFFSNSLQSPSLRKTIARHEAVLPLKGLIYKALDILTPEGGLSLILPVERCEQVIAWAKEVGLVLVRQAFISTKSKHAPPKRVLLEWKQNKLSLQITNFAIGDTVRHEYSDEFVRLMKEFLIVIP